MLVSAALHVELTAANFEVGLANRIACFAAVERQHEILDMKRAFRTADDGPLLVFGVERAIEAGAATAVKKQLAGELDWYLIGAAPSGGRKNSPAGMSWHLIIHCPQ